MVENSHFDKKSLRTLTQPKPDWDEIAKDCVSFANAYGGSLIFGIEDEEELPPFNQKIPADLPAKLQKLIQGRTINVSVLPIVKVASNGSEYLELVIQRNGSSIAATSNGRYYIRIEDECKPILPDELLRLMTDRAAFVWETSIYLKVPRSDYDVHKVETFLKEIRESDRVSPFVKSKTKEELLDYYLFTTDKYLTNLGVLWIGKREHRARLLYAPNVQFLKWDDKGQRVFKLVWDDYEQNPKELIQSIWDNIPDWREGIEIADGLYRRAILSYDETVVRELLANALVHRPYTIRGDIFINLYPDRLEFHNPGLLPLGVTPQNILHKSEQRNPHLAKVFYDLKLMEKEGSGYDRMYESLLSQGKPLPKVIEKDDRVMVSVEKRIINRQVIQFLELVHQTYQLGQKELISLGVIAQHNALTATEFCKLLGLDNEKLSSWIGRLPDMKLIGSKGKGKGTTYFVEMSVLRKFQYKGKTNLRKIEPHRLKHLILEDLERYGKSSIRDIHERIGKEIPLRTVKNEIDKMIMNDLLGKEGENRHTKYSLNISPPK